MAPVSRMDPRLAPMKKVIGVNYQGRAVCFLAEAFDRNDDGYFRISTAENSLLIDRSGGLTTVLAPDETN
jgi:hypothetical protein